MRCANAQIDCFHTVAAQMQDESSLLKEVQRLIQIRKKHTALQENGEIELLTDSSTYPLAYLRRNTMETILIVINPADKKYVVETTLPTYNEAELIFVQSRAANVCSGKITVYPNSASFFWLK